MRDFPRGLVEGFRRRGDHGARVRQGRHRVDVRGAQAVRPARFSVHGGVTAVPVAFRRAGGGARRGASRVFGVCRGVPEAAARGTRGVTPRAHPR